MIFTQFDTSDIVAGRTQPVSTGMWSDGTSSWTDFYTSSRQTTQENSPYDPLNGLYYTNVYDAPTGSNGDIYFAISYGNYAGSGSSEFDVDPSQGSLLFPTKAIYNQYRNLLLAPGDSKFTFGTSSAAPGVTEISADEIFAISFRSAKYKDRLDPGQFQISLSGSNGVVTLIDDSRINADTGLKSGGKRYNIVVGQLSSGSAQTANYQGLGLIYPDLGVIILNAKKISDIVGNVAYNGTKSLFYVASEWNNGEDFATLQNVLFESIKRGAAANGMIARTTEFVPARHFFVRVKNQQYNYSNNPTFIISADDDPNNSQDIGKLRFIDFYTNPKVYITAVGLYNDNNDLIAVAKLSQPLLKDFSNECLIKIKIDT
jgi:hypothetical protein